MKSTNGGFTIVANDIYVVHSIYNIPNHARHCKECGNSKTALLLIQCPSIGWCPCGFKPLAYAGNAAKEILQKFKPTPERIDAPLILEPELV